MFSILFSWCLPEIQLKSTLLDKDAINFTNCERTFADKPSMSQVSKWIEVKLHFSKLTNWWFKAAYVRYNYYSFQKPSTKLDLILFIYLRKQCRASSLRSRLHWDSSMTWLLPAPAPSMTPYTNNTKKLVIAAIFNHFSSTCDASQLSSLQSVKSHNFVLNYSS